MRSQRKIPAGSMPWVGRVAGHISDPVARLRFLQAVAPPASKPKRRVSITLYVAAAALVVVFLAFGMRAKSKGGGNVAPPIRSPQVAPAAIPAMANTGSERTPEVWLVERNNDFETYSNGLRIDDHSVISNHLRSYVAFPAAHPDVTVARSEPVGIIFHTTESAQAPFAARENGVLRRIGESLLDYIRRRHAYHFLIDRFGRVYRVVRESDAANHAGYSVWADEKWLYVNLNESFLGVSFEAQTAPGQTEATISPAQVRAGAMLTEMLRAKYRISPGNCITHAQVSVNPSNMRIGYHTDWASSFPYQQLALPDNYARDLPALDVFGFEYDSSFLAKTGSRMAGGVALAEARLKEDAARAGLTVESYRKRLRGRYRSQLDACQKHAAADSGQAE